jgi:hypothetical protein
VVIIITVISSVFALAYRVLKVKATLQQAMKAQRGKRLIVPFCLTSVQAEGVVANATFRSLYPQEGDPGPTVQETDWVPGPF